MLRYTTDRARPGLVALYDIRPGNGVGQFLQPRSPHGASAISSYRGNRPTNTPTHKQTGPITIHCAAASLAHSVTKMTSNNNYTTK